MSKKSTATTVIAPEVEAEYTIEEFSVSGVFDGIAPPDIVTAALHEAGVTTSTKRAAETIIKNFMKKEVK